MIRRVEGKGRCVFADCTVQPGDLVERSHVVLVPAEQAGHVTATVLDDYAFEWFDGALAIALGNGSLYSHSAEPNMRIVRDRHGMTIDFVARRRIAENEELTFDYDCQLSFMPSD